MIVTISSRDNELAIAASVLVLGGLIATMSRFHPVAGMLLVGFFAIFHGYAHGREMPAATGAWTFVGGVLIWISSCTKQIAGHLTSCWYLKRQRVILFMAHIGISTMTTFPNWVVIVIFAVNMTLMQMNSHASRGKQALCANAQLGFAVNIISFNRPKLKIV